MLKYKKIVAAIGIVLALFGVYNITWYTFVQIRYKPLEESVGYDSRRDMYITFDDDGYRYIVFEPDYLNFTSNLSIGKDFNEIEVGEVACSVIIWPLLNGDYEFGVSLKKVVSVDYESGNSSFETYNILLDEGGNPIDQLNDYEKDMLDKYKDQIQILYKKSYDMWGIGEIVY